MQDPTEFYVIAVTKALYLIHQSDPQYIATNGVHLGLDISDNLDKNEYYLAPNVFNNKGAMAYMEASIDGLISIMHIADQKGWMQSATMLRHIIDRITKGFAEVHSDTEVRLGTVTASAPVAQGGK